VNANQDFPQEVTADSGTSSSEQTGRAATACGTELAEVFEQALGGISGGRVLDVATAEGGFIKVLMRSLRDHETFVGIDHDAQALNTARGSFDQETIHFVQMDGERLAFKGGSFDTVAISASLHHLDNGPQVLAEMKRVLKPTGRFVLAEMHRDGLAEAQLTTVYLHHWVDSIKERYPDKGLSTM
jgi:ubiquinone/menaquinone biosynthesis C-methylase UbiE